MKTKLLLCLCSFLILSGCGKLVKPDEDPYAVLEQAEHGESDTGLGTDPFSTGGSFPASSANALNNSIIDNFNRIALIEALTGPVFSDGDGTYTDMSAVSSTEFGYVDGVTSAIQTQIDSKLTKTIIDTDSDGSLTDEDPSFNTVTVGGAAKFLGSYTVANIPGSPALDDIIVVTDGDTACDTTTGGGTNVSLHRYSGSAWVCSGDGGTVGGDLNDDECRTFGTGTDFQLCYDSVDDRFEIRNSGDTVLGYFGTDGSYTVVSTGNQGLQLDSTPDSDHAASGILVYETVDTNAVGIGACLNLASDGHLDEADASPTGSGGTGPCLYVAMETGVGSKLVVPLRSGPIVRDDSWNWTVGAELFLSETQGTLTETAPSTSGALIQSVGFAKTADIVDFHYVGYGRAN